MHSILEQLIATSFIHAERFITFAVGLDVGLTDELRSGFLLGLSGLAGLRADELSIGLRAIEPAEAGVEFSHLLLFSAAMPFVMFVFMIKFIPFIKFDILEFIVERLLALIACVNYLLYLARLRAQLMLYSTALRVLYDM